MRDPITWDLSEFDEIVKFKERGKEVLYISAYLIGNPTTNDKAMTKDFYAAKSNDLWNIKSVKYSRTGLKFIRCER